MIEAYSVEDIRAAEKAAMEGLPEGALMQRAARGLADALSDIPPRQDDTVIGRRPVL